MFHLSGPMELIAIFWGQFIRRIKRKGGANGSQDTAFPT
jgi:hypothetical protein